MEVIKCNLCKDEISYSQKCRVYIKSDVARPPQRSSKRPHLGRFKIISTAKSTEHISFARRLKTLRQKELKNKSTNSNKSTKSTSKEGPVERRKPVPGNIQTEKKSKKCSESLPCSPEGSEKDSNNRKINFKIPKENRTTKQDFKTSAPKEDTSEKNVKIHDSTKNSLESRKNTLSSKSKKRPRRMSQPKFQNSFEEYIKPIISQTTNNKISDFSPNVTSKTTPVKVSKTKSSDTIRSKSTAARITKTKSSDSSSDMELNRKGSSNTYQPTKNGNSRNSLQEFETYYWLDMPKPKTPESKKLGYQFENLVTEVKHMKLPNAEWKIKIMVHKQEMVSVSFSNKKTPEKVVTVNAKNLVCDISIDNKKLTLLGSPVYIYSIKDLEILLDVMNDIEADSSFIQYLN